MRPEEAFGAEWFDVDLAAGVFTVRRSFAEGRLMWARFRAPPRAAPGP
ncbi:hypothetical protein OM076_03930 [Solirubrobacter ginsenosidimutans]|uniref:Uncharacterized protein n=1 Tax=Solirubrobacter ginsenosidimutans TaxID=490573 RepID=A0A9X3MNF4_9ACTN|nr:hypothetical protein [Solirubrobacter ginsenosidimutans]MDA0159402.1 hypothetical protein [Solirubrobacter ginsenosidimutans]